MSRADEIMREHLRRNLAAICAEKSENPAADQRTWLEELEEVARLTTATRNDINLECAESRRNSQSPSEKSRLKCGKN